ncbi:glutamate ligase domain-containing protein, partial [Burkholderia mallei]
MTQVALKLADKVVLTADNPRTENPLAILKDMQEGMTCNEHYKTQIEPDRKTAIEFAVKNSRADDIVVIAGK